MSKHNRSTAPASPQLPKQRIVRIKSLEERFWAKVQKSDDGCWLWQGSLSRAGYGTINLGRRGDGYDYAHRVSYRLHNGPIPPGKELDHLCRTRHCIHPDHLEAVPHRINAIRGSHPMVALFRAGVCKRGHPMTADNIYAPPSWKGQRTCRQCRNEGKRKRYALVRK